MEVRDAEGGGHLWVLGLGWWRRVIFGFLDFCGYFLDCFLVFSEFSEKFWRILEVLEEFCNVERRLEGGDGLAPESFGK